MCPAGVREWLSFARNGVNFRPGEAGEPTYLVVYRDRQDSVRFLEVNAATARTRPI